MSERIFHITKNGESVGPYSEDQVRNLLKLGLLKPTDYFWLEGMTDWTELKSFACSRETQASETVPVAVSEIRESAKKRQFNNFGWLFKVAIGCAVLTISAFGGRWAQLHFDQWDLLKQRLASLIQTQKENDVKVNSQKPIVNEEVISPAPPVEKDPEPSILTESAHVSNPPLSSGTEWILSHGEVLPKDVNLAKAVEFPAILNGKVIGSIKKPSMAVVKLEKIDLTNAIVSFNGGRTTISNDSIDINELVVRLKGSMTSNQIPQSKGSAIQGNNSLHLSNLPKKQRDFILDQLSSQYLVLENNEIIHIRKPEPVVVKSNLKYQQRFSSSSVTDYRLFFDEAELHKRNLFLFETKISQSIGDNKYLIDRNNAMLEVPGISHLVDGESVSGLARIVGTYEYNTVINAHRRIPHYMLIYFSKANGDILNNLLDSGRSFEVVWPVALKCPQCSGLGKIKSNADELNYVACNMCNGKRELSGGKLYSIVR
jgi:hypothetical protein